MFNLVLFPPFLIKVQISSHGLKNWKIWQPWTPLPAWRRAASALIRPGSQRWPPTGHTNPSPHPPGPRGVWVSVPGTRLQKQWTSALTTVIATKLVKPGTFHFFSSLQKSTLWGSLRQNKLTWSLTSVEYEVVKHTRQQRKRFNTSQPWMNTNSPIWFSFASLSNSRSPPKQKLQVGNVLGSCLPHHSTENFHSPPQISQVKIHASIKCNDVLTHTLKKIKCFLAQS